MAENSGEGKGENSSTTKPAEVVTRAEYESVLEKARRLEAENVDYSKRFKGIDPDRVRANQEELDILRRESTGGDPKKIEGLIAQKENELKQTFGKTIDELKGTVGSLTSELKGLRVTNVAVQKAAEIFRADGIPLLRREIEDNCEWDGQAIVVKGADGKPRMSNKDPRQNMSLDEYLGELAEKYPSIAKPRSKSGAMDAGETASSSSHGEITPQKYLQMTAAERARLPLHQQRELATQAVRLPVTR